MWRPVLSDVFGLHPWHIARLTHSEYEACGDYIKKMNEAHEHR